MDSYQLTETPFIIDCLKVNYGLEVLKLIPVLGGADHHASVWRANTPDQTSYFVKLILNNPQHTNIIIESFLQEAAINHIIAPLRTLQGMRTYQTKDLTIYVYPFVEGENAFVKNLTPNQWVDFGTTLRQIHALTIPSSIQNELQHEDFSSKWEDSVRSIVEHIPTQEVHDPLSLQFVQYMTQHSQPIYKLLDGAYKLRPGLQVASKSFVLCHADLHGGNLIIDPVSNFFIVDWVGAMMAPRERDLMFIGGGVGNVWNKPQESAAFYQGYGETSIDIPLLAYYRIRRILEDIAIYSYQVLDLSLPQEDRYMAYEFFMSQFEPAGVIDIALKTYENMN